MTDAVLGIIGGSGIYDLPGLENVREETIESPWGEPSAAVRRGTIAGLPIVFLPRHDKGHRLSPSDINYRANIDVLKRAGVTDLISLSACGSFKEELAPGTFARQCVVRGANAGGRSHAEIDHFITVFARTIQHHRAAAADAAIPGLQDAQCEGGRDHRVHAVSPCRQHLGAYFGGLARLRDDDAASGNHCRFTDLLGVAELVAHLVAFAVVHVVECRWFMRRQASMMDRRFSLSFVQALRKGRR